MKNLIAMTIRSHAEACTTEAQNIEESAKITAKSGIVTRAESSLRTNIDNNSYSNSGFSAVPCERRARTSLTRARVSARRSFCARERRCAPLELSPLVGTEDPQRRINGRCNFWAASPQLPVWAEPRWRELNVGAIP